MASVQSRLWEYFLHPFYSKKATTSAKLNIKISRLIETHYPPKKILNNNHVKIKKINGRNIFTVIPDHLHNDKIIFYLHGGAYIAGITWPHWHFINKISTKAGIKIALVDYPVAPENNYIDTFNMILPAYETLLEEYDPAQIIFMGDSAGGGLALALAQELKIKGLPQPSKMVLLSPWLDVTMSNPYIEFFERKDTLLSKKVLIAAGNYYAAGDDRKNPMISPLYGNFAHLAEIHIFTGTHDLLAADARKLNHKLKNINTRFYYYEYDKMFHVWMFFPIPEARIALNKIIDIIM